MQAQITDLEAKASAPDLWDDPDAAQLVTSALSPGQHRVRARHRHGPADRRPRDARRDGHRGRRRRRHHGRGRAASWSSLQKAVGELEVRTLLVGRVRRARGGRHDPLRRRWRRRRRLRRDADADVPALGRAARLPGHGHGHLLRRGGRPEVGDLRGQRALRVRQPLGRGRHPPAGADQPVRQPGPAPDQLRRRRGHPADRADRLDRDPRERDQGRRLPLQSAPAARASTPPTPRSG